jgi:hypothetical protein
VDSQWMWCWKCWIWCDLWMRYGSYVDSAFDDDLRGFNRDLTWIYYWLVADLMCLSYEKKLLHSGCDLQIYVHLTWNRFGIDVETSVDVICSWYGCDVGSKWMITSTSNSNQFNVKPKSYRYWNKTTYTSQTHEKLLEHSHWIHIVFT